MKGVSQVYHISLTRGEEAGLKIVCVIDRLRYLLLTISYKRDVDELSLGEFADIWTDSRAQSDEL